MNLMLSEEWSSSPSQAEGRLILILLWIIWELGLKEAEERRQLAELYAFVVEFVKLLKRDQIIVATAMIYIHKFFKINSLLRVSSPNLIAASCVFLAAKVRYVPISLKSAAHAFFKLEIRT